MKLTERLGLKLLHQIDPERAHSISVKALLIGLAPLHGSPVTSSRLHTSVGGIKLLNPIGLAAGYDKNAEVLGPLSRAGFGFLEVGAATPRPQYGNPKPRMYRLAEDKAVINRFGFNNQGIDFIAHRLAQNPTTIPRGLNLGANKDSDNRADDFGRVLTQAAPHIDFEPHKCDFCTAKSWKTATRKAPINPITVLLGLRTSGAVPHRNSGIC